MPSTTNQVAPHYTSISSHFLCLQFTPYPGHSDLKHTQPITISLALLHSRNTTMSVSFWNISKFCPPFVEAKGSLTSLQNPRPDLINICTNPAHIFTTHVFIFSNTQLTILWMCIIWQKVTTSSIGHHQVFVQEHECIQKPKYHDTGNLPIFS